MIYYSRHFKFRIVSVMPSRIKASTTNRPYDNFDPDFEIEPALHCQGGAKHAESFLIYLV